MLSSKMSDRTMMIIFVLVLLCVPVLAAPIGAGYPDLMQKLAIFGIFAVGFNILFGLTGYLSFGHAAFLGVGSYSAVWMFKLLSMNVIPALILSVAIAGLFALLIGYVSLRRSGIYFSILTLAFAQMSYKLAYSVLTPITNGETGLQLTLTDPRILDGARVEGQLPVPGLFGLDMSATKSIELLGMTVQFNFGYYFAAAFLVLTFWIALRIFRSPFGLMLKAIKTNQNRLNYTGVNTRPYTLAAFVISGMYAGLAGGLLACMDPLAGAERMVWTASGEIVLMTILGGAGTLLGPIIGAAVIKFAEAKLSTFNEMIVESWFAFLPDALAHPVAVVVAKFVGEGWHLSLGLVFMLVVIFLPGGLVEGMRRISGMFKRKKDNSTAASAPTAAE